MEKKIKEILMDIRKEPRGMLLYLKDDVFKITDNPILMRVIESIYKGENVDYLGDENVKQQVLDKVYSLLVEKSYNNGKGLSYPITSSLRINNYCNFNCVHCYVEKKKQEISLDDFKIVIDNLNDLQIKLCILTGGETLLHPQLFELLDYAQKNYDGDLILNTNGFLLSEDIAKKLADYNLLHLHLSLDGTKDIHNKIRQNNQSFDKVIEATKTAQKYGLKVEYLCTVMQWNLHDIPNIIALAKELNVKVNLKRLIPSSKFIQENLVLTNKDVKQLEKYVKESNYSKVFIDTCYCDIKSKFKGCLLNTTQLCSIDVEGNIFICPFLHEKEFHLGNILKGDRLRQIYDDYYKNGRKFSYGQQDLEHPCRSCKKFNTCKGGCRADAFYLTKNRFARDSLCSLEDL